ncbi:MAG: helix-turn-helix domain-containing protein [Candidatus Micrarchaeia archaeon]
MFECELCGKQIKGRAYLVKIDSAQLIACEECAKGKEIIRIIEENKKEKKEEKVEKIEKSEEEIAIDYGKRIKEAREKLKIPLKVLAERINEKESYLKRVEEQEVLPNEDLVKKLEKELGIKLFEEVKEEKEVEKGSRESLSLEDLAIKKENRKR